MAANVLTEDQIDSLVKKMVSKGTLIRKSRGFFCTLIPNRPKGYPQYEKIHSIVLFQFLFRVRVTGGRRVLVHQLVWRHQNGYALVDDTQDISHLDAEHGYVNCTQESRVMNESRNYCHRFGWYKTKPGEDRPRCRGNR